MCCADVNETPIMVLWRNFDGEIDVVLLVADIWCMFLWGWFGEVKAKPETKARHLEKYTVSRWDNCIVIDRDITAGKIQRHGRKKLQDDVQ